MSDLLDLALDGHGGFDRWQALKNITATLTARGALFTAKGHPDGLSTAQATAEVTTPRLTFRPFAGAARGLFEPDRVAVTTDDGAERSRDNPRAAMSSLAPETPWDDLHLLYFTGYALWNYLCLPFLLTWPGFVVEEISPWTEGSQTWGRLRVTFPADVPTHGAEQLLYFDDHGLLQRLDYAAEVAGSVPVAHYCDEHREFSGLMVPTRRRVYARREDGTANTDVAFVELDITEVTVS